MDTITNEMIEQAIKECHWRMVVHGVDVCVGNCGACAVEIERGRCNTLRQLFQKARKEENKEGG